MSEVKIKITKSADFNTDLHPLVVEIVRGKLANQPYESVLVGACEDIKSILSEILHVQFRYEKTQDGHFFYVDEKDLDKYKSAFTVVFATNYEICK